MQTRRLVLAAVIVTAAAAHSASAAQMGRKPGLWEMKSTVMGMTSTIKQCVGPGSDDMMASSRRPGSPHADCSETTVKPTAGGMTMHAVCKMDKRTVTTDGQFTGSFDSSFKGHMVSVIDPPQGGMSRTEIDMESRYLGACAAGQKPGDVQYTPPSGMGGGSMNMNDPRVKEMMEKMRQQQGQGN